MAIHSQISQLPIIFQVGEGKIENIQSVLESKHLRFRSVLLVSGETFSNEVAQRILLERVRRHEVVQSNSVSEVERLSNLVATDRFDLVVGVGGGKVLDIVKRVSLLQQINHLAIPTVIASDGMISPISVLLNERGITESIPGRMPMGVIIDLNVISNAPRRYIQAAAGDILSNMSATNDWMIAAERGGEDINDVAFQMARMAAHSAIYFRDVNLDHQEFLKMIIQGQVNSGISMALAGTSRPCSGSEHLISHAIDASSLSPLTLHGYQVGALSLFCLFLQGRLRDVHLRYASALGLSMKFLQAVVRDREDFLALVRLSRSMRLGRVTILNCFSDEEIADKYQEYCDAAPRIGDHEFS